jgi:predicted RNA binding protein YcfA (HicA-like mRNA interferase family)
MSKTPALTPRKVISLLKRNGFQLDHATGSHYVFYHESAKKRVVVPYHTKDLPKGTLSAILKQAGLSRNNLGS